MEEPLLLAPVSLTGNPPIVPRRIYTQQPARLLYRHRVLVLPFLFPLFEISGLGFFLFPLKSAPLSDSE